MALVAAGAGVAAGLITYHFLPRFTELSREELLKEARAGHVRKVVITDQAVITGISSTRGAFRLEYKPSDADLIAQLRAQDVEIVFEDSGPGLI